MKRITSNIGLFFLLSLPAMARQGVYVNCQQGGQAVVVIGINSTNFAMASYPGCTITVKINGTATNATLFSDNIGTPLSNPFTASLTDGHGVFYADNGRYDIQLSGGSPSPGISPTLTVSDVLLNDPASPLGCSALPALTGDVTSVGATCATVLPVIATAGTGLKTTINAKGQVTLVTTAASTDLSDSANLPRLNVSNSFTGSLTASGNISGVQGIFSGVVTDAGETSSGEIAPTATGILLGDSAHRWDSFLRNVDISGTLTVGPLSVSSLTVSGNINMGLASVLVWNTDTSITRTSAGVMSFNLNAISNQSGAVRLFGIRIFESNSGGASLNFDFGSKYNFGSSAVIGWSPGLPLSGPDVSFSRISPGNLGLGNGTALDISGTLQLNVLSTLGANNQVSIGSSANPGTLTFSNFVGGAACISRGGSATIAIGTCTPGDATGTVLVANSIMTGLTTLKRVQLNGASPTCSVTGAGAGATCTVSLGSSDSGGALTINSGTAPGNNGVFTLTFSSSFGINGDMCPGTLANNGLTWNARASLIGGLGNLTTATWLWDNNAVNLTASTGSAYSMVYWCSAR